MKKYLFLILSLVLPLSYLIAQPPLIGTITVECSKYQAKERYWYNPNIPEEETIYLAGDESVGTDEEPPYVTNTYRALFYANFPILDIPTNANVTEVRVNYSNDGSSQYTFTLRASDYVEDDPNDDPDTYDEDVWNAAGLGQTIEQGIGYGSGSFISPEIKNNISTNFPNEGFTIGAVSDDEGVDGSEANLDIELVVTYEYEGDQIISLTAKNDLDGEDGAHIGVGFYPNVSPQSKQSPYEFDAYVTQRIRLEAYDNNPDASGKLWFFNDTEHTQEKSEWRDESGGSEFLSSSASYTTAPLATADDGAVYTAYLRTTDYTTSGTMTGNETWWTPVTVTNNLTIGSGVTLTVKEGTTVQVSNDKKISVYGTLNADDATFTASTNEWDGIVFESTGTGDIEYSTLSYASTAVQCNSTSAILFGNTFHHNGYHFKGIGRGSLTTIWENDLSNADYYAIYLDNHSAWIDGNTIDLTNGAVYGLAIYNNYYNPGAIIIENNSFAGGTWTSGIRVISGTATIQDNDIYNTGTGLLSDRMSNPKLRLSSNDGKNVITDNSTGISVMENALIDMGSGYNTIADNSSRNLRNYNESNEINAVYNYWGADPPAGEQILWRHRLQSLARRR